MTEEEAMNVVAIATKTIVFAALGILISRRQLTPSEERMALDCILAGGPKILGEFFKRVRDPEFDKSRINQELEAVAEELAAVAEDGLRRWKSDFQAPQAVQ